MKNFGYTLIELMITILLFLIILTGGTSLFFQGLKSSGLGDADLGLNTSLRTVMTNLEKDLRFSDVYSLDSGYRNDCVNAGLSGYSGDSITVSDVNGWRTVYTLNNGRVASISGQTGDVVFLSPDNITINTLLFTWYCQTNISDKIKIDIDATSLGHGISITRTISKEINLLNSGVN